MRTKTMFFNKDTMPEKIDEKIEEISRGRIIKNIAICISSGTVLGGGGFVYTVLYEQ